jgi:polar amino acid transport system substrate-binding protein
LRTFSRSLVSGRLTRHPALFGLVLLGLLSLGVTARAEVLQVTGSLWAPYLSNELENGGLAADLVRTALERAGYEVQGSAEPWSRAYEGAAIGVYDVVAAIWQNEARGEDLIFSNPYLLNDIIFMSRRGALGNWRTLNDLTGMRIGVVRDYAYDEAFDNHPDLYRVENNHLIQNLLLLRQGRLDVIVGDKWSILHEISQFMPEDIGYFVALPKPLARRALRLGVSRQNPRAQEIVAAFDTAIVEMQADGSYDEIVKRHTESIALLPQKR